MKKLFRNVSVFTVVFMLFTITAFAQTVTHVVSQGETLWIIAKKYQVGISEIINANSQLPDPNLIYPGDKINIVLPDQAVKGIEEQVADLVNKERASRNLPTLKYNWEVSRVARTKSEDMQKNNYFNHTSPTYGSPFEMLKKFNIKYSTAGENIAKGQTTAEKVMTSWMNSEGHRANILSPNFTEIGVGYSKGSTIYWTQLFIK